MLLADSNIWLALALSQHKFHTVVEEWLDSQSLPARVFFCRATQQSFLRLLTTQAVVAPFGIPPLSNKAAWSVYEGFHCKDQISWADEPSGLESHWKKLASGITASPKLWMDAYLAAFAITGGYQFVTTDRAFTQFKGLNLLLLPQAT
jgi:toxin-antitoxin system PIN domain toxin